MAVSRRRGRRDAGRMDCEGVEDADQASHIKELGQQVASAALKRTSAEVRSASTGTKRTISSGSIKTSINSVVSRRQRHQLTATVRYMQQRNPFLGLRLNKKLFRSMMAEL